MNRKKICKFAFLLLMLFLLIGIGNEPVAAANGGNYKVLYRKFLQKKSREKTYSSVTCIKKFYLLNIDKKGVPELFYTDGSYGVSGIGIVEVYTIKKQKVIRIGYFAHYMAETPPSFYFNRKTKSIFGKAAESHHGSFIRYNYQGGKWKAVYNCGYGTNGGKMKYYIQSRSVSKTALKKYYKKHFKSIKWKKYKMKELTPENLKAI